MAIFTNTLSGITTELPDDFSGTNWAKVAASKPKKTTAETEEVETPKKRAKKKED